MTRETVAGVVPASLATSEMVGWPKVLETIAHDRNRVNVRRDSVNVRKPVSVVHVYEQTPARRPEG